MTGKCPNRKMSQLIKWKPPIVQTAIFLTAKCPTTLCLQSRQGSDRWVGKAVSLHSEAEGMNNTGSIDIENHNHTHVRYIKLNICSQIEC